MSEKSEIYSSGERAMVFSILAVASLVISLVYLCCRINFKKSSKVIFIICVIYAVAFIFLNVLAMFDLVFNNVDGFSKFSKFISRYYQVFSYIDKILGFIIFNLVIYFLESGYYQIHKRLADGFIRFWYGIKKMTKCQIIVRLAVAIPLILILLILLIVYRDHFGLGKNPIDYLEVILDCYSIFEIYVCVGFFVLQLILDCRMRRDNKLKNRYYNYTLVKIIDKTEKYYGKINNSYNILNNALINFEKDDSSPHYKYLNETVQEIKEKINAYESESINPNVNNNIQNINMDKSNFTVNRTDVNFNIENLNNLNNNQINQIHQINQIEQIKQNNNQIVEVNQLENKGDQTPKQEEKKNEKKNEIDLELATSIRKYKKGVRRITKMKRLFKEIEKDKYELSENNQSENGQVITNQGRSRKCGWLYYLLFVPFGIVILTDLILPIALNSKDSFIKEEEYEKEDSTLGLIVGVLLSIPFAALCSSYFIITVYSTNRRQYISGDFLYDRKINDEISLMKTVQIVCGYSFAILYCNLFFWKSIDKKGVLGSPYFYEEVVIPDYTIKHGITILMIIKIIIIIATIIITLKFSDFFIFKNDLAEYNLSKDGCTYDNKNGEIYQYLKEKRKIVNILRSE